MTTRLLTPTAAARLLGVRTQDLFRLRIPRIRVAFGIIAYDLDSVLEFLLRIKAPGARSRAED